MYCMYLFKNKIGKYILTDSLNSHKSISISALKSYTGVLFMPACMLFIELKCI